MRIALLALLLLAGCVSAPPTIPTIPSIPGVSFGSGTGLTDIIGAISDKPSTVKWFSERCVPNPVPSIPELKVCIYETGPGPATSNLLFFHGFTKSADVFTKTQLYDPWKKTLLGKPLRIIAVSLGSNHMYTGYPGRALPPLSATVQNWHDVIMPAVEKLYPKLGKYLLVGHSQGGSNALTLASYYPEMFSKVAVIQPMLAKDAVDPFKPLFDIGNIIANGGNLCLACALINDHFPDLSTWHSYRPSAVMKAGAPPVWMSVCKSDMFKLRDAEIEYKTKFVKLGNSVILRDPSKCDHEYVDAASLNAFLGI